MICVVIGIVPPFFEEESERIRKLQLLQDAAVVVNPQQQQQQQWLRWTKDTWEQSWIVPDTDADDVPTLLLSAILGTHNDDGEGEENDNDEDAGAMTPEEFAAWVQEQLQLQLQHQTYTTTTTTTTTTDYYYRCESWASAPAPLPLVRCRNHDSDSDSDTVPGSSSHRLQALQSEFRRTGMCVLPGVLSGREGSGDLTPASKSASKSKSSTAVRHLLLLSLVDDHIRSAEAAIARNHPNIAIGTDSFRFREIASRSEHRFDLLVPRDTELYRLVSERVFGSGIDSGIGVGVDYGLLARAEERGEEKKSSEEAQQPYQRSDHRGCFRTELLQRIFSNNNNNNNNNGATESSQSWSRSRSHSIDYDWEMDLSIVYSKPGANHQGWHADGGHAEGAPDDGWGATTATDSSTFASTPASPLAAPYAVCLFVPLVDLDHTVGFTQFWPGSHRHRALVGFGPFAEVSGATFDGIVRAGDALWYDYRLLHRGMPNTSKVVGAADAADADADATDDADADDADAYTKNTPDPPPYRPVLQLLCRRTWYKEKNNYGLESIYGGDG